MHCIYRPVYVAIRIFGDNPFTLRIYGYQRDTGGTRTVPVRPPHCRKKSVLAQFYFTGCSHTHIHFSRIGSVGYIHSTWLVPLELYLLLAGLEKRKSWMAAAAGVLLAIHFCVYLTSQVVVALILVFMVIALIFLRRWFLTVLRQCAAFCEDLQ